MSRFLSVVSVDTAVGTIKGLARTRGVEDVPLEQAAGRILAKDLRADADIPGFTRSVVDGFAVLAADTIGAGDAVPAILHLKGRLGMGDAGHHTMQPGDCIYVPTGGVLPEGADAVVMVEQTETAGDVVLVRKTVAIGENVLLRNEDYSGGDIVLAKGRRLSAQDCGVAAAAGHAAVPVFLRPVVGIISTGNELVPVSARPGPGQVRDSNSFLAGAFVQDRGCIPRMYGIVRDDRDALRRAIAAAVSECHAVLVSGGSSKDERDMTAAIIAELGEVLIHGIAIAPGKPTIIGRAGSPAENRGAIPVIGLPGHPASAFIVLFVIVRHLLDGMSGCSGAGQRTVPARLAKNIPSQRGREDYVRVALRGGEATPLFGKSGLLNTLVKSDGIVRVAADLEGLEQGSTVEVILW